MTNEIYEKLKPYESAMRQAKKGGCYIRMSQGEFNAFAELYRQHFGTALTTSQKNCSHCKMKALKAVGEAYEQKTAQLAKEALEAAEKARKAQEEAINKNKPKRTRKRTEKKEETE